LLSGASGARILLIAVQTVCCARRGHDYAAAAPAHVFRRDTGAPFPRAFGHSKVHRYAAAPMVGIRARVAKADISGGDR
jgi:hypothetical protein